MMTSRRSTGLTDAGGKQIYEGDILMLSAENMDPNERLILQGDVRFDDVGTPVVVQQSGPVERLESYQMRTGLTVRVIGQVSDSLESARDLSEKRKALTRAHLDKILERRRLSRQRR